jgi:hypothetical protein
LKARWTKLKERELKAERAKTQQRPGRTPEQMEEGLFTEIEYGYEDGSEWPVTWKVEMPFL